MTPKEMMMTLKRQGYNVNPPAGLEPEEEMYMEGDYLAGSLHPRNWKALTNRRVPWPQEVDPNVALAEFAQFMEYQLLAVEATARGQSLRQT